MAKVSKITLSSGEQRYKGYVYLGTDMQGKSIRKSVTRKTKKEVEDEIRRLKNLQDKGVVLDMANPSFHDVYLQWREIRDQEVKASTVESYDSKFKTILKYLGRHKIKNITPAICQHMVTEEAKIKKSVANYRMYANLVFNYAIQENIIIKNPMASTKIPKRETDFVYDPTVVIAEERKYWTKSEVLDFLQLAKQEFSFVDYVAVHTLLFTGMRKGELHALLRNGDIDYSNKLIKVRKTLYFKDGVFSLHLPKTNTSARDVTIDDTTIKLLRTLSVKQKESYLRNGWRYKSDGPVFNSHSDGDYMRIQHLNVIMDAFYLRHPEFKQITIHQFRHTHASLLFESGASIKDVQHRLGHQDIQTTMNIYTHVTRTKARATESGFAQFMGL